MEKWIRPTCELCKKEYKSKKSLWNHNNKYHKMPIIHKPDDDHPKIIQKQVILENDQEIVYPCRICNKEYTYVQGRWKHEQKCKQIEKEKE